MSRARLLGGWMLLVAGCANDVEVGRVEVAPEAGVDPRASLQLQIQGTWCGTATAEIVEQEIRLQFGPDTYTVRCDCEQPFPGESAADGSSAQYAITDSTLNGEGWGRAEHELPGGSISRIRLEHIELTDSTLRFERVPDYGARRVVVELTRYTDAP